MRIQSKNIYHLFIITAAVMVLSMRLHAQQKTPITEQVDVIRQYKPILGDAVKIKKSPSYFDENIQPSSLKYNYKNLRLLKDTARNNIVADSLRAIDSLNTPFLYLKAGAGNLNTALGEINLNSRPSKNGSYGAWFRHLSQRGKLENQQFFNEQAEIFGKKILETNFISGSFLAKERQVHYYGYDHALSSFTKSATKQNLINIGAIAEFGSLVDSTDPLSYGLKIHGNNFNDHYSNSENLYEASGLLGYIIGPFSFNFSSQVAYNKLKLQNGGTFNTSVFRAEPYITLQNKLFRLKAGINIVNEFGDKKKILVFPDASLDLLLSYGFNLFGGIKGDVLQNTYSNMTEKNQWINGYINVNNIGSPLSGAANNLLLANTRQNFDFFTGIKGAFTPVFNYRAQVETGVYNNLYFFVNQPNARQYFSTVYAGNGTTKEEFYAEVNYLAGSKFRININLDYLDFRLKGIAEAWHTPKLKSGIWLQFNPSSHWMINGSLYYTGEQKAAGYTPNGVDFAAPIQYTLVLPAFTDISLGFEYRINKKISLFINGNNLLNTKYQNYLNYPVLGLNAVGGISITL